MTIRCTPGLVCIVLLVALTGCGGGDATPAGNSSTGTYSISGTVTAAQYSVTDSDVNDTNTTPVSNDGFDDAQEISAPVAVSGYVNVAGAGESGNSQLAGDPDDYFVVSLTEGMTVTLRMVEDPGRNDLNLYLYDENRNPVDASLTAGDATDSLTLPEDGIYYVRVEAVSSIFRQTATVYALTIGQTGSAAASYPLRLSDDFVPGEALVRFENRAQADAVAALAEGPAGVSSMGFAVQTGAAGRDRLLRRADSVEEDVFFERLGVKAALERSMAPGTMDEKTRAKMKTLWMVRALARQSGVRFAEPNYIRRPLAVPNDALYDSQWHYPFISLPDAWDISTGNSNVVVAVVDTGVLLDHPDINGQLVSGYDFISSTDSSLDGDGVDADPDDPGDLSGVGRSSFHGTHVAGTIAAASNNGIGVAGIAWNARIMPLRALGYGGGTAYDIIQAVKYAAGLTTDYAGVQNADPVEIINLSLGGTTYSQTEALVYEAVRAQGVIIVAAAGNNASAEKVYPAAYNGVVSVSAVTITGSLAAYSSHGDSIDVAAPGGSSTDANADGYVDGVLSTIGDDSDGTIETGYAFSIGTSMAAPHVSGVVALMKALYPAMTPDQFDALLKGGYLTRDLGDPDWDSQFGWGLIDAYQAVLIAQQGGNTGTIPAILTANPRNLNFGAILNSADVTVANNGNPDASLTVTDVSTDGGWLLVQASSDVGGDGLGTYTVTVNRGGLADGTYTGAVTFTSNKNQARVAVVMQVGTTALSTDSGYHYILLLDADTHETVGQVGSAGDNGTYSFTFSGLSSGDRVVVYAGTDPNNDGYICDEGESCGAYLSLDQPVVTTVTSDMENFDFTTDINLNLSSAGPSAVDIPLLMRDKWKEVVK
jgi:serine protease